MSRVGKYPVQLPSGVTATVDNNVVHVKGKLGELSFKFDDSHVSTKIEDNKVVVTPLSESIEARAFKGFNYLTSLTLPESLTSIGNFAFSGCNGLTSVAIPESVTNLKMGAFEECSNLATVEFMGKNPPSFYSTNCFKNTNCNFLVPCGTLDVYRDSLNIRHSDGIIVSSRVSQSSESAFVYTISSNDASFGSVTSTKEPSCSDPIWSFRADD